MHLTSKRLFDFFQPQPRFSNKLPALYLDSCRRADSPHDIEVYLVNQTGKLIDHVRVERGHVGSDGYSVLIQDYTLVLPGEAVLLEEFDEIFDSDFLNQLRFSVQINGCEEETFNITKKGISGLTYRVLRWHEKEWSPGSELPNPADNPRIVALAALNAALQDYLERRGSELTLPSKAERLGCYHCLAVLRADELAIEPTPAVDVHCPRCGINALVPDNIGIALDADTLAIVRHVAFSGTLDEPGFSVEL